MTERTIDVRGIPVLYEEIGEGRPVLVVHGFSLEHRVVIANYEPVFANRSGYRRIYLDMPGHGRTPAPDWLETEDQVLEVLTEFVEAVAPGERLVLIGQS
jgi:pimeloyl-ACP methyl ester carboxylesterase